MPLLATLPGSVYPDFNLIWFWLVDHGTTHRHLVHAPDFRAVIALVTLPELMTLTGGVEATHLDISLVAVLVQLVPDTLASGIM